MPLSGLTIKTEYNLSEESSSSHSSPRMVETASPLIRSKITSNNISSRLSPTSNNLINSKMLLTPQNLSHFEQRLASRGASIFCDDNKSESFTNNEKHLNGNSSASSLFTIDSILSKQTQRYSDSSPSSSPSHEPAAAVNSTFKNGFNIANRLPASNLFQHHPGLHITHLASNFGSPEFLGKMKFEYLYIKRRIISNWKWEKQEKCVLGEWKISKTFNLHFRLSHGWISRIKKSYAFVLRLFFISFILHSPWRTSENLKNRNILHFLFFCSRRKNHKGGKSYQFIRRWKGFKSLSSSMSRMCQVEWYFQISETLILNSSTLVK